ncbi:phosphoadenosine phosphosulfate reductase family protein [Aeromonas sp. 2HA2]|uniref:phosphoadenosine phosphosulfate reductase family protein n=1 Tax=unclassified Aeromonas TaxID=257493 RepID=UPI0023DDBFF5|nr:MULTISPECIES: phosphoadenosine phosphosulfate reductase family protein [unclassified Aeromonas]MDF2410890.1 phosphoadenosine phosphosulfate reductase family protein [Aeromonas sp. 2HA2]MDF2415277.1 phosphoadenosine phosphosulfate reductase family protein [Aeromonas sp. 1HA1]
MIERHVLGISGGKDSAALAVYMRDHHPELEIDYFFTDTGEELPEVEEFLGKLEGYLGKPIIRLNPGRDFRFWLRQYNNFLPSPQTRWCTRQLKLAPFEQWVKPWLVAGDMVTSYVAIRSDEEYREGYSSKANNLLVKMPFREAGINKAAVIDILENSGIGYPKYYEWRSRSGCTFCFFQQKIEWVRLRERHPEAYEEAKALEKDALEHGSPFTWSKGESLTDLENPERIAAIKTEYESRRARLRNNIPINPLRPIKSSPEDIDDIYGIDEGNGSCNICHK